MIPVAPIITGLTCGIIIIIICYHLYTEQLKLYTWNKLCL
jgi:hypothetical protein